MKTAKKILIIDDDPDILDSMSALLELNGYETVTACDGDDGLAKARADVPDLVLLDLLMPHKSGMRFLNDARNDPALKDIPVVILSGASRVTGVDMKHYMADHEIRKKKHKVFGPAMNIDPQAYIEKPFDPAEVVKTVKKFAAV